MDYMGVMQNDQFRRPLATLTNRKTVLQIFDMPSKLGRNDNAVDVYFFHESISREHCIFECINGRYTVTDLGSTVGTFIDGFRLEPNVPYNVEDGAKMKLGKVKFTFNADYAELDARRSMQIPQAEIPPQKYFESGVITISARELNDYEYNEEEVVYIDCGINTDNKPKIYTTSEPVKREGENVIREDNQNDSVSKIEEFIDEEVPNDLKVTQKFDLSELEEDTGEIVETSADEADFAEASADSAVEKSVYLKWIDDETGETRNLHIDRFPFYMGRKSTENDYAVVKKGFSRRHMHFEKADGEFYICDDDSTNGTKLNGSRIDSGVRTIIKTGDHMRIAGITFNIEIK